MLAVHLLDLVFDLFAAQSLVDVVPDLVLHGHGLFVLGLSVEGDVLLVHREVLDVVEVLKSLFLERVLLQDLVLHRLSLEQSGLQGLEARIYLS